MAENLPANIIYKSVGVEQMDDLAHMISPDFIGVYRSCLNG